MFSQKGKIAQHWSRPFYKDQGQLVKLLHKEENRRPNFGGP